MQVSVVIPTYNEATALPVIVPKVLQAFRESGLEGEVIVVDDDSPDGTASVARELGSAGPVRVLERKGERGLSAAALAGFRASQARVVAVMDADGSHPVGALPEMVGLILRDEADIVVGSRNIPGGGAENWSWFSRAKSRFAAWLCLGLAPLTDPTTGYMAVRRDILDGLDIDPIGWKIVLEVVVKAAPARLKEVPIVFRNRELGESKQSLRVLGQYLHHLWRLRRRRQSR